MFPANKVPFTKSAKRSLSFRYSCSPWSFTPKFHHLLYYAYFTGILQKVFGKKDFEFDARLLGGRRAIIMSGEYDRVFPMDIFPEYLVKAIIAGDIDRMEALGIYEVAPEDFALCEFVDTSKLEIQKIVRQGLDVLYKEMN